MKLFSKILLVIFLVLLILALFGPRPKFVKVNPTLPALTVPLEQLETHIALKEKLIEDLKVGNGARIIWNDSVPKKTEYCLLYLHGFSASATEGAPVHTEFAARYGMNLFLPRLEDHGRESINSFEQLTPESYMNSAKEALKIASLIGDKVIIMGCSTGATLGAYLAAHHPDLIDALFFYSPNIDLYDSNSRMFTWPWGKQMLKSVVGSDYYTVNYDGSDGAKFWNSKYHINGLIALKGMINQTMTKETFEKINQPTLICSYYKNDELHDDVVSHDAMQRFYDQISTSAQYKEYIKFPDVIGHVFTSEVFSDDYKKALSASVKFAEDKLGLRSIESIIDDLVQPKVY